jgi:hypothetical protein
LPALEDLVAGREDLVRVVLLLGGVQLTEGRMRVANKIVADIEKRHEAKLGRAAYATFKQALRDITTDETKEREAE